jgi:hypothetical protein
LPLPFGNSTDAGAEEEEEENTSFQPHQGDENETTYIQDSGELVCLTLG